MKQGRDESQYWVPYRGGDLCAVSSRCVQLALSYPFQKVRTLRHLYTNSCQSLVEACSLGLWQCCLLWTEPTEVWWSEKLQGKSHKWYVRTWWVSSGYGWDQWCLLSIYNKQNFEKQCFLEHLNIDYKFDRLNSLKLFKFHYKVSLANSFWPLHTSTLNIRQNIYKMSLCNLLYI